MMSAKVVSLNALKAIDTAAAEALKEYDAETARMVDRIIADGGGVEGAEAFQEMRNADRRRFYDTCRNAGRELLAKVTG